MKIRPTLWMLAGALVTAGACAAQHAADPQTGAHDGGMLDALTDALGVDFGVKDAEAGPPAETVLTATCDKDVPGVTGMKMAEVLVPGRTLADLARGRAVACAKVGSGGVDEKAGYLCRVTSIVVRDGAAAVVACLGASEVTFTFPL